ncbi:hypothetical protein Ndes2437A_g06607 [Nannochloris sp. 'desiccata']
MQAASRAGDAAKYNTARETFNKRGIVLPQHPDGCQKNSVNLRKSSDATGTRSIWKLNQASGAFGGINSARTYPENVLSATSVPSLAKSGKFKVSPFTAGNGKTVTLAAEKATSKGAFLAVNKACTGLGWSTSGASSQAKFTVSSA